MEERQRILICLGAAVAANCGPCFQHYYKEAQNLLLTEEEIAETVEIGNRMKTGAIVTMTARVNEIRGGGETGESPDGGPTPRPSCCSLTGGRSS